MGLYQGILADCQKQFDDVVSKKSKANNYTILFTTIMKLRRLCNHGSFHVSSRDKALFFTAWRSTLDLLERMLTENGIQCRRIDGRVSISDRTERLSEFQFNPDNRIPVLLLSIETGAVRLTLTAADRVHIVEPQWNPSVEQQAIGRALRIGQTRKVTIIKYIVQNTVEENIVTLQKKKSGLAKFSLDSRAEDTQNEGLDDLKFVLDN
ncbi:hypothetical protein NW757_008764 [Fusarium falciforme]|nr:hypothetical protein NW757_008764 [Fusarium falciforme]